MGKPGYNTKKADRRTVLIVDDDISIMEYLDVAIQSAGHRTVLAFDGEEALKKYKISKPDLVILDALIPKVDGFEVCRRMRQESRGRVPVVMMTGVYTKHSYRTQAVQSAGAAEYVLKPFGISEVWRILRDHLQIDSSDLPTEEVVKRANFGDATKQEKADFFRGGRMALEQGTPLKEVPLALCLRGLHRERSTGLLFLRSGKATSIFYLDRGQITFVRSNDPDLRLDRVLVKLGKIDEGQYEKAQELFKSHRGKRRMGEILVGMQALTRAELEEGLRFQLQLLVAKTFQWTEGAHSFAEGELPATEEVALDVDIRSILFKGVKGMADRERVVEHLPSPDTVLRRIDGAEGVAEKIGLTAFERQMLNVVDGTKTVRQVVSIGKLANVEIEQLLFAFLCASLIEEDRVNTGLLAATEKRDGPRPKRRSFRGELNERPVPQLLHAIHRARKTGVLTLQHEGVRKWLQIERGEVIFAGSEDERDRIGRVLVESNLISEEDFQGALSEAMSNGGKRIGRILVDRGLLTLEELYWAVVFQVQRIALSLFHWAEGSYIFREGPLPTRETITLDLNTPNLILEGVRSLSLETVERWLPDPVATVRRVPGTSDLAEQVKLSAQEQEALGRIREEVRVDELMEGLPGDGPEGRRMLYGLQCIGLLEVSGGAVPAAAAEQEEALGKVAVAGGAPPASVPIPHPAAPPKAPAPIPPQAAEEPIPRFLYEELLEERKLLEEQVLELYAENCDLERRAREAHALLSAAREGEIPFGREEVEELLELLARAPAPAKPPSQ